ncbi:methylated-DNA--protein-cysteine methyltransferase [Pseudoleptotrichia goodfellowii]|jgi:O-6-methylguanine DNA methyltransferase|uniref:Methylated-DNA--protein-cysteine methyltransferase n=1 Tax=Pseudoleptotrichia goodfellowii TaxID=157692 RepID=A0A510JBY0_9FUSO|nr:methylated-DNA--[protein]-cysteine S-methyltransferase [Pseudoleptotrichia goodfellowii]BBM36829.1 methylated-DNA--protein-cysteine methyltransferase [Pseudoleptotrichia goodfellowii]
MRYVYFYDTKTKELGTIGIAADENHITNLFFEYEIENIKKDKNYILRETFLIKKASEQLFEYLTGKRKDFELPLLKDGTDFQISVWNELIKIPYGETRSYKDIAVAINNEKAVRAVGMANNRNKISIFIPCHRVIGSDKKLVGYGGGLEIKKFLLNLEKMNLFV